MKSSDNSHFTVRSFHWKAERCYNNSGYHRGRPRCFPHDKRTQAVTGSDLKAEDAGTIRCAAAIKYKTYLSDPFTIRISGEIIQVEDNGCLLILNANTEFIFWIF